MGDGRWEIGDGKWEIGNGKWELEDRKSVKDLAKCNGNLKIDLCFTENQPRIHQKSFHYRLEGENP